MLAAAILATPATGLIPPPAAPALYPVGQFTNGDTGAVQLGADLPLVNNSAFGGARAMAIGDPVPDFAARRQVFVAAGVVSTLGLRPLPAGGLLLVAIGGRALVRRRAA